MAVVVYLCKVIVTSLNKQHLHDRCPFNPSLLIDFAGIVPTFAICILLASNKCVLNENMGACFCPRRVHYVSPFIPVSSERLAHSWKDGGRFWSCKWPRSPQLQRCTRSVFGPKVSRSIQHYGVNTRTFVLVHWKQEAPRRYSSLLDEVAQEMWVASFAAEANTLASFLQLIQVPFCFDPPSAY